MSRYVDLDGKTWDGTPISSKIQEVKTKFGYMQGITVGWLWGDNVPKLDLEEHDKQIYNHAYEKGRTDAIEQMDILGLVKYKAHDNPINRKRIIEIDYADCLNAEQIAAIVLEQLKEKKNDR